MPIRYEITNGALPVTVHLMQGVTVIDSNVHNAYEEGQFDDIVSGEYTLEFVDSMNCIEDETISPDTVLPCDVFFVTGTSNEIGNFKVYSYNPEGKTLSYRFDRDYYSPDIACTDTRMWIFNDSAANTIKEYVITLNPFSVTFNRELNVPVDPSTGKSSFYYGQGLDVIEADDITNRYRLVSSQWNKYRLNHVTFDNTINGVADYQIVYTGKFVAGDIKYHPVQDLYTITTEDYYDPNLREVITYANGIRKVRWSITTSPTTVNPWGLFIYEDNLYMTDVTAEGTNIYKVLQNGIELYDTLIDIHVQGCAQVSSCGTFVPFTTTSTTTTTSP